MDVNRLTGYDVPSFLKDFRFATGELHAFTIIITSEEMTGVTMYRQFFSCIYVDGMNEEFGKIPIRNGEIKTTFLKYKKSYLFAVASSFIINLTIRNTTSAIIAKSIIAPTKSPTSNFTGPT